MTADYPLYRCHKEVRALKIDAIEIGHGICNTVIAAEGRIIYEQGDWGGKFRGSEDDLGYYVVYEDGYTSWSPTKAFEEGYSLVHV